MKTAIWTIIITVALMAGYQFYRNQSTLTSGEFRDSLTVVNRKLDSLDFRLKRTERKIDTIQVDVRITKLNVDTIKQGQVLIFNRMQENRNVDFWSFFK